MSERELAAVRQWLVEPLPADVAKSIARLRRLDDVQQIAVLPDVHLASDVCVGVALATEQLIYPAAVGSDIGCGMAAIGFATSADELRNERNAAMVLARLRKCVPTLKHSSQGYPAELPRDLSEMPLSCERLRKAAQREGRLQMGTVGRGNHFVELQTDGEGRLWLMVHSGSRGMGQLISQHHLDRAQATRESGALTPEGGSAVRNYGLARMHRLIALDASSDAGASYLADAAWAAAYAAANRAAIVQAVTELLSDLFGIAPMPQTLIQSDHNHVRREVHGGRNLWVHRKGALSAAEGQLGMIPGSMGTASFHVAGRGNVNALCSSSHGAGRALRRGDAMRAINERRLMREMEGVWFDTRLTGRLCDEAPSAYKDIHAVMRAQRELTRIVRELRSVLSYKGV